MNFVRITIVLIALFGSMSIAAMPAAAAPAGNNNPDHPACVGDKYYISSEGANVGGAATGSKWWIKPVCSGEQGDPVRHSHEPDDILSSPESFVLGCHETGREVSPNFVDDSC